MALQGGDIFAGCRILGHCGQGTYGSVYLAEDAIGRRVALKILESPLAGEREIQGLRNFMRLPSHSEALLEIYHIGRENGQFYYLMELADDATGGTGEYQPDTLARRLKARKRLPLDESVTLCLSLLDGLEAMHRVKLLHRDIKPENILFVRGRPKLGDPGLVGDFSHTLSLAGTVGYIPPELLQPNSTAKPSPSSDLYALGKVLYCMVTGNAPQDFPSLPTDMEMTTLLRVCAPLSDLCNAIPRKRCGDCGEARRKLLSIMEHHSPLWLVWQRFLNDSLWRRHLLSMLTLGLATLVLVNTLFFVEHSRRQTRLRNEARALLAQRDSLAVRLRQWQRHQLSLAFQLSILGEKFPLVGRLAFADRLLAWNDLRAVHKILDGVDEALPRMAQAHLPPVAAPEGAPPAERLRVNAHAFGYLASPLCALLPISVREGFSDAARLEAESLVKHGGAGKTANGKALDWGGGVHPARMVYLPPGSFRSPFTERIERIDYPFWILETELSVQLYDIFSNTLQTKRHIWLENPVTNIGWNDCLGFCNNLTEQLQRQGLIPPGYAVRPPTEAEWEYAALDGMPVIRPVSISRPPTAPLLPAAECSASPRLGLKGMDSNLSELVSPYPDHLPKEGWKVARGSTYRQKSTGIAQRTPVRPDQTTLDSIGFRPVVAPTAEDYLEREWFKHHRLRTAMVNGKWYAGIDSCLARTTWQECQRIATALGARLPQPASDDELEQIFLALDGDLRYPVHLGIVFRDGGWRNFSDSSPSTFAAELNVPPSSWKVPCLGAIPGRLFFTYKPTQKMPSLFWEYPTEDAMVKRPVPQPEECFELEGRKFGLLKFSLAAFLHQPFLDFAGHRFPVIHDPGLLERLAQRLKDFRGNLSLGCYRSYDGWRASDGTRIEEIRQTDWQGRQIVYDSINYSVLVASDGRLMARNEAVAMLVELPPPGKAKK